MFAKKKSKGLKRMKKGLDKVSIVRDVRLRDRQREPAGSRLKELEPRYRLKCPQCGHRFWIDPSLVKTSTFDGSLQGFRCPGKDCGSTVPWEKN